MRDINIVSEIAMSRDALERAVALSFGPALVGDSLNAIVPDSQWHRTVTIIDIIDLAATLKFLLDLSEDHDLHRVVLLVKSHHTLRQLLPIVLKVGAIIPNTCSLDDICQVANAVREGLVVLPLALLSRIESLQVDDPAQPSHWQKLTGREVEVLTLLAKGASNKVIAHRLGISDSTVRVHIRSILGKLRLKNRTEAALMAVRHISRQPSQTESKAEALSSTL